MDIVGCIKPAFQVLLRNIYSSMQYAFLFFGTVFPGGRVFFSHFRLRSKQRGPSVYYDACLDLSRAPWRHSEPPTSLSWLFIRGLCSASLRRSGAWKTPHCFYICFILLQAPFSHFSLRSLASCATPSVHYVLPSLLSATTQLYIQPAEQQQRIVEHHVYVMHLAL